MDANKRSLVEAKGLTRIQEHQLPVGKHKGIKGYFERQQRSTQMDQLLIVGCIIIASFTMGWVAGHARAWKDSKEIQSKVAVSTL